MAFEALNHIGHLGTRLVIVLNDNEMSISQNVGALASYLARVRLDPRYNKLRDGVESKLAKHDDRPDVRRTRARRSRARSSSCSSPGCSLRSSGLKYVGPSTVTTWGRCRRPSSAPRPTTARSSSMRSPARGRATRTPRSSPTRSTASARSPCRPERPTAQADRSASRRRSRAALVAEAAKDERIVAITAAMPSGTGLDTFRRGVPGSLLRRRNRRGARGRHGSRAGRRRPSAGGRRLLDVHAARL